MRDDSEDGNVQLEKNSSFFDHTAQNFSRVISIKGVKYTTAPHIAHEVVRLLSRKLQPRQSLKKVAAAVKPSAHLSSAHEDLLPLLENRYGARASQILSYIQVEEEDSIWIDKAAGLLKAELKYLINEEMACKLSDVILRRTGLGTAGCPDRNVLEKVAECMGASLDWDKKRRDQEIETVMHRYLPLD